MGDLQGSPRVALLFLGIAGYHSGSPLVVPMGHPITRYGPSKSCVFDFSPFSAAWKIPSFRDDRLKRQAFWTVEAKVMGGNAWWRGWVPWGIGEDMFHEAVGGPWCMEREIK